MGWGLFKKSIIILMLPWMASAATSSQSTLAPASTTSLKGSTKIQKQENSWLSGWKEHYKKVFNKGFDRTGTNTLLTGAALSLSMLPFEKQIQENVQNGGDLSFGLSQFGSKWGAGMYTSVIVAGQLLFDFENGIPHAEAFIYTSLTSGLLKSIVKKERPNQKSFKSFPSGHTATATVAAASLWNAYGWQVGVPFSALAVLTGLSRISDNSHYASDVIMGATLALFWTRAVTPDKDSQLTPYFDLSRGVLGWHYTY